MKYHLTYEMKAYPEGITKEEVPPGCGACTTMIIAGVAMGDDGSSSHLFASKDGRNDQEVSDNDMFRTWTLMAKQLSESEELSDDKKAFCKEIFEIIRQAVVGGRKS